MKQICLGYKRKCSSVYCSAHPKRHTSSGRCSSDDDDDNNSLTTSMPTSSLTQSHKECHSTRHIIKKEINDTDSELTYVERARSENSVCLNKDDQPVTLASVDSEDEDELRDLLLSAGLAKWASRFHIGNNALDSLISLLKTSGFGQSSLGKLYIYIYIYIYILCTCVCVCVTTNTICVWIYIYCVCMCVWVGFMTHKPVYDITVS